MSRCQDVKLPLLRMFPFRRSFLMLGAVLFFVVIALLAYAFYAEIEERKEIRGRPS